MTRTRILMVLSLIVVFAAGLATGLAVRRQAATPPPERRRRSWLTDELKLTPEQRTRMAEIWSEAMEPTRGEFGQRGQIYEERDEEVRALLDEGQQAEYDRILEDTDRKLRELGEARRQAFEQAFAEAVARTKEILTPEQRLKYDEMLNRMPEPGRGPRRGRGMPGLPRPGRSGDSPDGPPEQVADPGPE